MPRRPPKPREPAADAQPTADSPVAPASQPGKQIVWSRDVWDTTRDEGFVLKFTMNLRSDLHRLLKLRAAHEGTTMGKLIENWIEEWSKDGKEQGGE